MSFKQKLPKGIIIGLNISLCLFFSLALVALLKSGASEFKWLVWSVLAAISIMSLLGFFFKNSFGWFLTAFPTFLFLILFLSLILPKSNIEMSTTAVILLCFNLVIALVNFPSYQAAFNIKGKQLVIMNIAVLLISFGFAYGLNLASFSIN